MAEIGIFFLASQLDSSKSIRPESRVEQLANPTGANKSIRVNYSLVYAGTAKSSSIRSERVNVFADDRMTAIHFAAEAHQLLHETALKFEKRLDC